jgi:hypothetical protein
MRKLSLVIQREGTKLPEIFDLIIRVFVLTTVSTTVATLTRGNCLRNKYE